MHKKWTTGGRRRTVIVFAAIVSVVVGVTVTAAAANAQDGVYFNIRNDVSGRCVAPAGLSHTAGQVMAQMDCGTAAIREWLPVDLHNGYYLVQNRGSGLCLHIGSSLPETPIDQVPCVFEANQEWQFGEADEAGEHLVLVSAIGNSCLALQGVYSGRVNWPIVIHDCATTSGQFWRFV